MRKAAAEALQRALDLNSVDGLEKALALAKDAGVEKTALVRKADRARLDLLGKELAEVGDDNRLLDEHGRPLKRRSPARDLLTRPTPARASRSVPARGSPVIPARSSPAAVPTGEAVLAPGSTAEEKQAAEEFEVRLQDKLARLRSKPASD